MGISNSPLAFPDCIAVLSRALNAPKGIRITFDTHGEAKAFQGRLYKARLLDRRGNLAVYEVGHPLRGHSAFDKLELKVLDTAVLIVPRTMDNLNIEEIT